MKFLLAIFSLVSLASCQMPGENDFSTIPATNNPAITRQKPDTGMPGMNY